MIGFIAILDEEYASIPPRERRAEFSPAFQSRELNITAMPRVALATIELTLNLLAQSSLTRRQLHWTLSPSVETPG
jgi:hypothetical protein